MAAPVQIKEMLTLNLPPADTPVSSNFSKTFMNIKDESGRAILASINQSS
jgi:hypothetical protein